MPSEKEADLSKTEVEELMKGIFNTLDRLTSNHFVPLISGEIKVIKNQQAVNLEDPSYFVRKSNASIVAKGNGEVKPEFETRQELTTEENQLLYKKRKRNLKNRVKAKKRFNLLKDAMKTLDSKFESKMMLKKNKDKEINNGMKAKELRSTNFFSNIQKSKHNEGAKQDDNRTSHVSIKSIKL